ncbi:thymidine kinase [Rhizobium favelukesii]|uniref:Thymidine kinase n=2 Tax=Rhizobium/Agrobacterium group TaxID=227290 RepID=W6RCQ1_9HYPH|nr:thymidine kinase [Rhizobium favelukesii]
MTVSGLDFPVIIKMRDFSSQFRASKKRKTEKTMAKLYFNYSTMNAGKSTMLLQASYNYEERGMRVVLLIAAFDERVGKGIIGSRIGLKASAVGFEPEADLQALIGDLSKEGEPIACVFVDEAHFMTREHVWQLARIVDRMNIPVMVYGLRTDFQGKLFPASEELLAIADEMREVRTICHCGRKATMVVRLDAEGKVLREGAQIDVGGNEKYVSLCRRHWDDAMNGEWLAEAV